MKFFLPLLIGILLGACRQDPSAHVSGVQPEEPGVEQPLTDGGKVDPGQVILADGESINESRISVLEAAKLYESYSNKRVIMTKEISKSEVSFQIKGPLTNEEAAIFLKLTLLTEGFAMVPFPDEAGIVRLIPSGPINN